jgi:hypothetical protein
MPAKKPPAPRKKIKHPLKAVQAKDVNLGPGDYDYSESMYDKIVRVNKHKKFKRVLGTSQRQQCPATPSPGPGHYDSKDVTYYESNSMMKQTEESLLVSENRSMLALESTTQRHNRTSRLN